MPETEQRLSRDAFQRQVLAELAELRERIETLATLACPVCGPALLARLHPEQGKPEAKA